MQLPFRINSLLHVQYGAARARCRVVWLGKTTEERGQIGIRCLDEDYVPWSHLVFDSAATAPADGQQGKNMGNKTGEQGWPEHERRRVPRYSCDVLAHIRRAGDPFSISTRLIDVGLTGGYLQAMSPLPMGTEVHVILETGRAKISLTAVVRTLHPAMGNGVEFTRVDLEALEQLQNFLTTLGASTSEQATTAKGTEDSGGACSDGALQLDPQVEALVQLLEQKSILKREELLHLLQKSRARPLPPLLTPQATNG
jgi:hypothetical protein